MFSKQSNGKCLIKFGTAMTVFATLALLDLAVASGEAPAPDSPKSQNVLDEIRQHGDGLAIWWTGHNGWLIKSDDLLLGIDLVLDDQSRKYASPISATELADELDISFITHGHGDHFNAPTSKVLAEKSKCLFVIPRNCLEKARDFGIPENRIAVARPRQPMEVRGIKVDPLRALHGNRKGAVYWDANLDDCGYVFHLGGKSIMQPGDSVLLEDHIFVKHVDVLFVSPTEHNMQIDDSITLINELEPDYILPQHRDTYPVTQQNRFWTYAYTYDVQRRLSKGLRSRYHIVDIGRRFNIAP